MENLLIFVANTAFVILLVRVASDWRVTKRSVLFRIAAVAVFLLLDFSWLCWRYCRPETVAGFAISVALSSLALPTDGQRSWTLGMGRTRFPIYILSTVTVLLLAYLHLPISTFLTSPGEIGIHLGFLLSTNLTRAMVVVYLAAGLYGLVILPRLRVALTVLAFTSLLAALLYSYVLPFGYPMLSGLAFERVALPTGQIATRGVADALVVAVAAVTGILLLRVSAKGVLTGLVLVNLSLGLSSAISIARDQQVGKEPVGDDRALIARPLSLSKEKPNVLILFLDRFMGGYVEEVLRGHPSLHQTMSGFVWYPRTVAAGENSVAGVHPIFGGYDYTPREMNARHGVVRDISVEAYGLLPYNFTKKGYRVSLVNPRGLGFTMAGDCSVLEQEGITCSHVPSLVTKTRAEKYGVFMEVLSRANYADLLVLLGAMRAAPYLLKEVLHERGPWAPFLDHSAGTTFREWAELSALPELTATDSPVSNLNVFSNILPHEPYFMGEDCKPQATPLTLSPSELRRRGYGSLFELQHANAARCVLLIVADYLGWMKQAGVYDNTKIVIVSDHGIVGDVTDRSSRAVAGGTTSNAYVRSRSVLFVKERHARGELSVSEAFMPNAEVPRIVCEDIGGCVNPHLGNRAVATLGRDDPFYVTFVPWQFSLQKRDALVVKGEMCLRGRDPYDARGWSILRGK